MVDKFVNSSSRTGVQFSLVRVLCTSPKTFRVSGGIIESRIRWRTGVETETESGDEGSTGTSNGSGRVSTTTLTVAAVIARCPDIRPPGNVLARKLFIHSFIAVFLFCYRLSVNKDFYRPTVRVTGLVMLLYS